MGGYFPMGARRDGMWLGAGELAAEQRERLVRRRLHDALVHGAGTVWGLGATACEPDDIRVRTRILVRPGLAIDALDREIYVDREQCLDVASLVRHPIWAEMLMPEGAASRTVRRAYIVLRHEPTLAAARPSPSGSRFSRAVEPDDAGRFRLELAAAPPPDPAAIQHDRCAAFLAAAPAEPARAPSLALALQDSCGPAAWPWPGSEQESLPLLLATVDLDVTGQGTAMIAFAVPSTPSRPNPDNRVRALVPGTRRVAEVLFGEKLPVKRPPTSRRGVVGAGQR
jgi:hypothetical protein